MHDEGPHNPSRDGSADDASVAATTNNTSSIADAATVLSTRVIQTPTIADDVTKIRSLTSAIATEVLHDNPPTSSHPKIPDAPLKVAVGATLSGRFQLDECLGKGGMGVVYRATDLRMPGVPIAVKLLKSEYRENAELLNMLRESVRKVRSLPHPNIASVYSLESDGQNDFVVMELMQGQTLHALLDGEYARGIPLAMARVLIADMCSALAYAHDHGVIHSDIKPSNIFVTPSWRAKLFDFDIARVLRGPVGYFDASKLRALTHAYATTEMVQGEHPDQRDDVYAVACVIYEILSGKHPFGGASSTEANRSGLQMKPLPLLSARENQALAQALKFDRETRLADVESLRAAFIGNTSQRNSKSWLRPIAWSAGAVAFILSIATIWWFIESAETAKKQTLAASATAELDHAKTLALHATELAVDGHDATLRDAISLLRALPTDDLAHTLKQAQKASSALLNAISHAPRIAHLGTTQAQIEQALQLCRELHITNQRCSPRDMEDESLRSISLQPFTLDSTPVTNHEFDTFVQATGYRTAAETTNVLYVPDPVHSAYNALRQQNWRTLRDSAKARGATTDTSAVLGMDIDSARAYCKWTHKRLPSEDEWEYSTRGPTGKIFPWGDTVDSSSSLPTQVLPTNESESTANSVPPESIGKVAEWTESRIAGQRVLRGASWLFKQPYFQRLVLRRMAPPGALLDGSFRCASSVESWPDSSDQLTIDNVK